MPSEVVETRTSSIVTNAVNPYSRLLSWEVWNFMSLTHAKADFDECNIINFKGYNDSGKSAMLRALDVLLYNIKPNAQVGFIQDDKDYFRIMAYFDDGIMILRDKYINGKSLYEVYKGNECLFTTKSGNSLTKVSDVPQVIQDYLGVISCEKINLNSRSCFEKQLLVQTTGSENYNFFNVVLKSEEIAIASSMLNTDKNKLLSDLEAKNTELAIEKGKISGLENLTEDMLDSLHVHDKDLDRSELSLSVLNEYLSKYNEKVSIPIIPKLSEISSNKVDLLYKISGCLDSLSSVPKIPELKLISDKPLEILIKLMNSYYKLSEIKEIPELILIDLSRIDFLNKISKLFNSFNDNENDIENCSSRLEVMNKECQELQANLMEFGKKFVKCKNCGALVEVGSEHC